MTSPAPPRRLALIGGGEHARVVREAALLAGWEVPGCFDVREDVSVSRLGPEEAFLDAPEAWPGLSLILCVVGARGLEGRRRIVERWAAASPRWASVIHPTAFVSPTARLGRGVFIGPGAIVHTGARIDDHAIVNSGAVVEHDVVVGQGAHLSPGVVTGGGVEVGAWATVGLGARVRDHVQVGAGAFVAMGAVVVTPVAPGALVLGCPARPRRPTSEGA